jgi:hypothetical protein
MASSEMLRRVALARTDVSEELSASFIRVTKIGELGTMLAVLRCVRRLLVTASVVPSSPILVTLMTEPLCHTETSVLTRATRRNIPEDAILQVYTTFSWPMFGEFSQDVRFEVFILVTTKNAVFWDVMSCGSCKNRSFGVTYRLHHQGDNQRARNNVSSN